MVPAMLPALPLLAPELALMPAMEMGLAMALPAMSLHTLPVVDILLTWLYTSFQS